MLPWQRLFQRHSHATTDDDQFPARQLFVLGTSCVIDMSSWLDNSTAGINFSMRAAATNLHHKILTLTFTVQHYAEFASPLLL